MVYVILGYLGIWFLSLSIKEFLRIKEGIEIYYGFIEIVYILYDYYIKNNRPLYKIGDIVYDYSDLAFYDNVQQRKITKVYVNNSTVKYWLSNTPTKVNEDKISKHLFENYTDYDSLFIAIERYNTRQRNLKNILK